MKVKFKSQSGKDIKKMIESSLEGKKRKVEIYPNYPIVLQVKEVHKAVTISLQVENAPNDQAELQADCVIS